MRLMRFLFPSRRILRGPFAFLPLHWVVSGDMLKAIGVTFDEIRKRKRGKRPRKRRRR